MGNVRNIETGDILKPSFNKYTGYYSIGLYKNHILKTTTIHRLVAETFIPNPQKLECINHKDENKANNCVLNLEWCSREYNTKYSNAKAVKRTDQDGNIKIYPSVRDTENDGFNANSVSLCCRGKQKKLYKGYQWQYITKDEFRKLNNNISALGMARKDMLALGIQDEISKEEYLLLSNLVNDYLNGTYNDLDDE